MLVYRVVNAVGHADRDHPDYTPELRRDSEKISHGFIVSGTQHDQGRHGDRLVHSRVVDGFSRLVKATDTVTAKDRVWIKQCMLYAIFCYHVATGDAGLQLRIMPDHHVYFRTGEVFKPASVIHLENEGAAW